MRRLKWYFYWIETYPIRVTITLELILSYMCVSFKRLRNLFGNVILAIIFSIEDIFSFIFSSVTAKKFEKSFFFVSSCLIVIILRNVVRLEIGDMYHLQGQRAKALVLL